METGREAPESAPRSARSATDGHSFARNSVLNLTGLVLPIGVALVAIPPLLRGLGAERFSILTLAATAIGYFGLFELGLGRALTQGVAQRLGTVAQEELPAFAWTGLAILLVAGLVAALAVWAFTPLVVTRVLKPPPALHAETETSFRLLAFALPLVITTAGMRGIMEAHQHFGMVNALRVPLVAFTFIGPLLVLPFSHSLVPSIAILVGGRFVGWALHVVFCARHYPFLRRGAHVESAWVMPLLRYGGWITVTNVVGPFMVYLDRFFLAAVLPLAAVAYYVTPFEAVTKLLFIASAITTTMFPAFAATFFHDKDAMRRVYDRSVRTVLLAIFPLVLATVTLAHEGLDVWVHGALPWESAIVLRWLAIGILINAAAQAPYSALQGAGRPDLIAKVHMVELPVYVVMLWRMTLAWGLTGAAVAWTLRVTIDAVALLLVARHTLGLPIVPHARIGWLFAAMVASLAVAASLPDTLTRVAYTVVVLGAFAVLARHSLLRATERQALRDWLRSRFRPTHSAEELA